MRKNLKLFAAIYALCSTCAYAGAVEIRNETDSSIRVFVRVHGEGNFYHTTPPIPAHGSTVLMVDKTLLSLQKDPFYYDIIASNALESTIEPDWRLLAGECDNLFSVNDALVIIQSIAGGLKTTCKVIKNK
jgi:hypothetical protein